MLASERVIINAPMSFAGAYQRTWRLMAPRERAATAGPPVAQYVAMSVLFLAGLSLLGMWWVAVLGWYCTFGLLLVPYRLLRRGARKNKQQGLRHREMMAAMEAQQQAPAAPSPSISPPPSQPAVEQPTEPPRIEPGA